MIMDSEILYIHNIYLVSKYYLIRVKSAFAKALRIACNFNTKFNLIQN